MKQQYKPTMRIRRGCSLLLSGLMMVTMAATLFSCGDQNTKVPISPSTPELSDTELPNPTDSAPTEDTTDYESIASAVFDGIKPASFGDFTYETVNDGIKLTEYHGEGGALILPEEINGISVTTLGDALFQDNGTITALSIPNSVTTIGKELLNGCRSLQVLRTPQLGETREDEGYLAYLFGGTSAQTGSFKVSSALDTVILTDAAESIPTQAFYSCYRLVMVILPEQVKEIGNYAFYGCSSLKYVSLTDNLRIIGDGAFANCTSLLSATIPDGVESIGLGLFMGCTSIEQLSLPYAGKTRNDRTFLGYFFGAESYYWNRSFLPTSLRYVTIRDGDIPDYMFYECTNLYKVILPEDCTSIGVRAFHGCSSLLSITLPSALTHIGDMAFSDCTWLSEISMGNEVVEIGMQAFMGCINLSEITLSQNVTILSPSMFAGCKRLKTVTVSDHLTTIDDAVFRNCISLITVKTQNGAILDSSTVAIGKDNTALENCLTIANKNFHFKLTWNTHGISSYDSATGLLIKTTDTTHPEDFQTTLQLSATQLVYIRETLSALDLASYPEEYDPDPEMGCDPTPVLILEVMDGENHYIIRCEDASCNQNSKDPKGPRLIAACDEIIAILTGSEQWNALPEYEVYYD